MNKLYVSENCSKCHEILNLFNEKRIDFISINESHDAGLVSFLLSKGFRGFPVLEKSTGEFLSYGAIKTFLSKY